jgi:hypothetical protein
MLPVALAANTPRFEALATLSNPRAILKGQGGHLL